ncbi:MAG: helicase-related protein, partial [Candidatus Thermoplasmatota archaeon]|nr:helicase-related protein [Candidatus Thermoplasmatota archaeon]
KFRVRGDRIDIFPSYGGMPLRVIIDKETISDLIEIHPVTGKKQIERNRMIVYPAKHFVMPKEKVDRAIRSIKVDLERQLERLSDEGKQFEATRLKQRTLYDIELIQEVGYCPGIENYSRYFDGREPGDRPFTLIDYFPDDFLLIIDESHVTLPQIRGMYKGDRSRKENLVDFGFRLPSAFDNRPLTFIEFEKRMNTVIYTTATPAAYEKSKSSNVIELIIRPTGLVDPEVIIRPAENQVDDVIDEIRQCEEKGERVLVTTLTKRMAEDLSAYLVEMGIKAEYMHSGTKTIERIEILRKLRLGTINVLVGINLLREGLDLPEVSLVAILDADKEGFLRNETSLIQTMGRAARNVNGKVILYAKHSTKSIKAAVEKTNRRRIIQLAYNAAHGIEPRTIRKDIKDITEEISRNMHEEEKIILTAGDIGDSDYHLLIIELEEEMKRAAGNLEFEKAARLRDRIIELKNLI